MLFRDHQPEQPHVAHALDDRGRVLVGVLELRRHRDDLFVHEVPHGLQDLLLNIRQTLGLR
jgi:hypothetical protein